MQRTRKEAPAKTQEVDPLKEVEEKTSLCRAAQELHIVYLFKTSVGFCFLGILGDSAGSCDHTHTLFIYFIKGTLGLPEVEATDGGGEKRCSCRLRGVGSFTSNAT